MSEIKGFAVGTSQSVQTPPDTAVNEPTYDQPGGGGNNPLSPTAVTKGNQYVTVKAPAGTTALNILGQPAFGDAWVTGPDTLAVSFIKDKDDTFQGDLTFDVDVTDGSGTHTESVTIPIIPVNQLGGFGPGQYYMLETDPVTGDLIIEPGQNHNKVHAAEAGLTATDIAARHGVSEATVTGAWLETTNAKDSGGTDIVPATLYGATPALELETTLAIDLYKNFTKYTRSSTWLLFKEDPAAEYVIGGGINDTDQRGESPLHPILIGTYGSGGSGRALTKAYGAKSLSVTQNIDGEFIDLGHADGVIISNVGASDRVRSEGAADRVQTLHTWHRVNVRESYEHNPTFYPDGEWPGHSARAFNFRTQYIREMALIECDFNLGGWQYGYHLNQPNPNAQPPSIYSHNLYVDTWGCGLTLKRCLIVMGANTGAQIRYGYDMIECVSLMQNQHALIPAGQGTDTESDFETTGLGEYTTLTDNLFSVGGGHGQSNVNSQNLAPGCKGIEVKGADGSCRGNAMIHGTQEHDGVRGPTTGFTSIYSFKFTDNDHNEIPSGLKFDNTMVYNWPNAGDVNLGGLSTAILDAATVPNWVDANITPGGSVYELVDHVAAHPTNEPWLVWEQMRKDILTQLGKTYWNRVTPQVLRYNPPLESDTNPRRADIRFNWEDFDLPGRVDGDDIELNGWETTLCDTWHQTISGFDFGSGGRWSQFGGVIKITGDFTGTGTILGEWAGQVRLEGVTQDGGGNLFIADNGRVHVKSQLSNADLTTRGYGEMVLTNDVTIDEGRKMTVKGRSCFCGWDGPDGGNYTLSVNGTLCLESGAEFLIDSIANTAHFARGEGVTFASGGGGTTAFYSSYKSGAGWMIVDDLTGPAPLENDYISGNCHHQYERRLTSRTNGARVDKSGKYPIQVNIGMIKEFFSGHYDADRNQTTSIVFGPNSILELDLAAMDGAISGRLLADADSITNGPNSIVVHNIGARDVTVTVDQAAGTMTLDVTASGSGTINPVVVI